MDNNKQIEDLQKYCKNKNQYDDALNICKQLDKKGYNFYINRNFTDTGLYITIADNIQIEGQLIIFDDGNWIKDIYLKNISLYEKGHTEVLQELIKYNKYKITGTLPINI